MYDLELKKSHFPAQNDAEILNITIGELLREVAAKSSTKTALVDILDNGACGQSWTYKEIYEKAESLALSLSNKYKKGERIVVWAPNIPEWVFMEYACGLAGLVLVTANPSFQAPELRYVIEQSKAVGLFMVNDYRGNPMEDIAKVASNGNTKLREIINLETIFELYSCDNTHKTLPIVEPHDPAQIQYTSGTT